MVISNLSMWKERIDKILILNPSVSLESVLQSSRKLKIIPTKHKGQIKVIDTENQFKELKRFMSQNIIPKTYGGKAKELPTWPPCFNKGVKPSKLADIYFLKIDLGLRPYFQNSKDFDAYNRLKINCDSETLSQFVPVHFEEVDEEFDIKAEIQTYWRMYPKGKTLGTFDAGTSMLGVEPGKRKIFGSRVAGSKGKEDHLESSDRKGKKDGKGKDKSPKHVKEPEKKGFFSTWFGCAGAR